MTERSRSRRVLLVEDESLVAMMAAQKLSQLGFEVVEASSAREALDHASASEFQIAVVDLGLPDRPGEELIADLTALRPDLPVVVASGYSEDIVRDRIKRVSGVAFLNKPYDLAGLQSAIEAATAL